MKLVCVDNKMEVKGAFSSTIEKVNLTIGKTYEVIYEHETFHDTAKLTVYSDLKKWEMLDGDFLVLFKPTE